MFFVNLKKQLIVVISLLIVLVSSFVFAKVKGSDEQVYIEMYDRQLNHIANIIDVKYEYTRRVYDFDTSNFSGICDENIENTLIFVLCDEYGNYMYSGFVKNLSQDGKLVKFKGEDFKTIFDTDIIMDYASDLLTSPRTLGEVFSSVVLGLENQIELMTEIIEVDFVVPSPSDSISWIGTYDYEYVIKNAKNFLKPYLAYYNYYIESSFDRVNKKIVFEIKKHDESVDIRLDDFIFESQTSEVKVNKAVATLKWNSVNRDNLVWKLIEGPLINDPRASGGAHEYLAETHYAESGDGIEPFRDPNQEFIYGSKALIIYWNYQAVAPVYYVYIADFEKYQRPDTIAYTEYYLGLDNLIYRDTIDLNNLRIPIRAKIFEEEYFATAQFNAINELVNSRYNENIILTNVNCPIDLSTLELNTLINIYDKNNNIKQLPVSEIINNNGLIQIKLGFKKTLFTEIIKN